MYRFILTIIGIPLFGFGQQSSFPEISVSDFKVSIDRHEYFDGASLWGLINGGADIYLEYGLDKMLLEELSFESGVLRVEIYQMKDAVSAYGIYSVSKGKDTISITNADFRSNITNYQVQFTKGKYYGSVILQKSSESLRNQAVAVVRKLSERINEPAFAVPKFCMNPELKPYSAKIKYFKGPLGIQNGASEWSVFFEGLSGYEMFYIPVKNPDVNGEMAFIRFSDTLAGVDQFRKYNFLSELSQNQTITNTCKIIKRYDSEYYLAMIIEGKRDQIELFIKTW